MTNSIHLDKTYGVVHNKDYFSFFGFTKKIGSDETQKINVYMNDKLIDTIIANEYIEKIDDMYNIENQAFTYNLPLEYVGKKATISFKNHDTQEKLLNSPYTLIDNNHENFNELKFMHSLNEPISEELKNTYKPNSIGFLATKENLEDEEFVEYINQIIIDFPKYNFKAFFINQNDKKLIKKYFKLDSLEFIELNQFSTILNNVEFYLSNNARIIMDSKILNYFRDFRGKVLALGLNLNFKNLSVKEFEEQYSNFFDIFFNNLQSFGFKVIDTKNLSYHTFFYNEVKKKFNIDFEFSLEEPFHKAAIYWPLIISNENKYFHKFLIDYLVKNKELREKMS